MRYGIREICNVVFRATAPMKIGSKTFGKGQPVFFMDSAKTSTLESAATAVYATGGRGNARLVTWEGEKTLTFTVEDALITPVSFAMLSGAGVVSGGDDEIVHVHMTTKALIEEDGVIDLSEALNEVKATEICAKAPLYIMKTEEDDGSITGDVYDTYSVNGKKITVTGAEGSENVLVDYYVKKKSANVKELQVDAAHFAGTFYVEAETLFRAEKDGQDYPATITIPKAKIQSNWTFSMASSGDPSTFSFVMDAMPGYTYFNQTKKVLCVIQIVEDVTAAEATYESVMKHSSTETDLSPTADEDADKSKYTVVDKSTAPVAGTAYYIYNTATKEFDQIPGTGAGATEADKNAFEQKYIIKDDGAYSKWKPNTPVVYTKNA